MATIFDWEWLPCLCQRCYFLSYLSAIFSTATTATSRHQKYLLMAATPMLDDHRDLLPLVGMEIHGNNATRYNCGSVKPITRDGFRL